MKKPTILDVSNTLLDESLELMRKPPIGKLFVRNMFPTNAHKDEWIRTAPSRPDADVKLLLRNFLVSTGSSPTDRSNAEYLQYKIKDENLKFDQLREHEKRLLHYVSINDEYPVWEGLGWVLDLLPDQPRKALDVIDSFFHVHWQYLEDNYLDGLFDAQMIIRNRYIESSHTKDLAEKVIDGLNWHDLECLCGVIYKHMGFKIEITPRGNDDGVDVFAENLSSGQQGKIVIQAKKWNPKNPVEKRDVRELLGTIDQHRATKGVLITTGHFARGAIQMEKQDSRIELIDRDKMLQLLNEHCGADWYTKVDKMIMIIKSDNNIS